MMKCAKQSLFLGGLVVVSAVFICVSITSKKEALTYSQEVLHGDVREVEGLHVSLASTMNQDYYWLVDFPLDDSSQIDVTFDTKYEMDSSSLGYFEIETAFSFQSSTTGTIDFEEDVRFYPKGGGEPTLALIDVASRTQLNETHTETVRYADYYEYYPIHVAGAIAVEDVQGMLHISEAGVSAIRDYFKYPVDPDHELTITITKNGDGVCEVRVETRGLLEQGIWYHRSVMDGTTVYFHQINGDRSGVHRIDLFPRTQQFDVAEITPIITIEEGQEITAMRKWGETLALILYEEGEYTLVAYSLADYGMIGEIPLGFDCYDIELTGEVAVLQEGYNEGEFMVVEQRNNTIETVLKGEIEENLYQDGALYNYGGSLSYFGGKLIIARELRPYVQEFMTSDCWVMVSVFDESGLVYKGKYVSSQVRDLTINDVIWGMRSPEMYEVLVS
ncbi:MAG: hypothetical protein R3Y07_05460 [Eubacteriales bacterium]